MSYQKLRAQGEMMRGIARRKLCSSRQRRVEHQNLAVPRIKQAGFTFIEVLFTMMLLSLMVFTVQSVLSNLFFLQGVSNKETTIYRQADNLLQWIRSGKGVARYLLTPAEKEKLQKKGYDLSSLKNYLLQLSKYRFLAREKKIVFEKKLKLDDKFYKVIIEREIIEPSPFLFGINIKLQDNEGKEAELKGIISYYDFESSLTQ